MKKNIVFLFLIVTIVSFLIFYVYTLSTKNSQIENFVDKINSFDAGQGLEKKQILEIQPSDQNRVEIDGLSIAIKDWQKKELSPGFFEFSKVYDNNTYAIQLTTYFNSEIESNSMQSIQGFNESIGMKIDNKLVMLHIPDNLVATKPYYNFYNIYYPLSIENEGLKISFKIPGSQNKMSYSVSLRMPLIEDNTQFNKEALAEMISIIKSIKW